MGGSPNKIQFPVGILERMRQCSGRCTELNYHSSWIGSHASHPGWSNHRHFPEGRRKKTPMWFEGDQQREKEVWVATGQVLVEMHVTNWAWAQKEDPELDAVLQWLESKKKTDLRTLLGEHTLSEEGWVVWRNCQNLTTLQGTLYLCSTPKGENEDLLLFVVAKDAPNFHLKWVPLRCRISRPWPYSILIARTFLVARNGKTDETSY